MPAAKTALQKRGLVLQCRRYKYRGSKGQVRNHIVHYHLKLREDEVPFCCTEFQKGYPTKKQAENYIKSQHPQGKFETLVTGTHEELELNERNVYLGIHVSWEMISHVIMASVIIIM